MLLLHTDHHFSLQGDDLKLWLATCSNADVTQRLDVYIKAARVGRVDVLEALTSTFESRNAYNDVFLAAVVYEQFECADWIEQNTDVDMFLVEHILYNANHFNFKISGEDTPVVNNDKPFLEDWIDHKNMKKCRIQKELIEQELEPKSITRLRKI